MLTTFLQVGYWRFLWLIMYGILAIKIHQLIYFKLFTRHQFRHDTCFGTLHIPIPPTISCKHVFLTSSVSLHAFSVVSLNSQLLRDKHIWCIYSITTCNRSLMALVSFVCIHRIQPTSCIQVLYISADFTLLSVWLQFQNILDVCV